MDSVLKLLPIVIWPAVTLVAVIFVVLVFRGSFASILRRTKNLELWKLKIETMEDYVGPGTLAELRRNPDAVKLTGERRHVTIMIVELAGGTSISEQADPESTVALLQEYSSAMIEAVFRFGGTLDRYVGESLTAYWGAPIAYPDSAGRACSAALAMRDAVAVLSTRWQVRVGFPLRVRIGITTGDVLVGNIGTGRHFRYSVLGDTLEILPRLARLADEFRCPIVLTEFTRAELGGGYKVTDREQVRVKGKEAPVRIFELVEQG